MIPQLFNPPQPSVKKKTRRFFEPTVKILVGSKPVLIFCTFFCLFVCLFVFYFAFLDGYSMDKVAMERS